MSPAPARWIASVVVGSHLLIGCASGAPVRVAGWPAEAARGCSGMADPFRSTFVIYEVNTGRTLTCNAVRAQERYTPASTFKIPHALIAIENGLVADEGERFAWDRRPRGVAAWDRDASLAEAVRRSTVWVFQDIATRLGHAREKRAVRELDYGNADVGGPEDLRHFWLSGPLAISAVEQVGFLTRLRSGALPASASAQARTTRMLRMGACGRDCAVYGKTGAVLPIDDEGFLQSHDPAWLPGTPERTGWFVGWVDRPDAGGGPVVFAHNLDLALPGSMPARTAVAWRILAANGVDIGPGGPAADGEGAIGRRPAGRTSRLLEGRTG